MPSELRDFIDDGWTAGGVAFNTFTSAMNYLADAADDIWNNQWLSAHDNLDLCGYFLGIHNSKLLEDTWPTTSLREYWRDALHWIDDNWPADGAVSMADIINAMLAADPDEVDYFIGIVDAYRVAIWDKPFNEEFYRALAEGFKQWG